MASKIIYEDIKKKILHMDLLPGLLISELDLCERYGISRTPTREAIKALSKEGLLEVKPHIGTFVSKIDINKVSDTIYIRRCLELSIVSELCSNFNPSYALPLQQILSKQQSLINSKESEDLAWDFMQLDNDFHAKLFELAGKQGIWQTICSLNQHYIRFRIMLIKDNNDSINDLFNQHNIILRCLLKRDAEKLSDIVSEHITDGFQKCGEMMINNTSFFILPDE